MNHFANYTQLYRILSRVKTYIDSNTGTGDVQSVSVDNGVPVLPDLNGNVNLSLDLAQYLPSSYSVYCIDSNGVSPIALSLLHSSDDDPLVRASYISNIIGTGFVQAISTNGVISYPDANGIAEVVIDTYTLEVVAAGGGGGVQTVSIDGGTPVQPDQNGNIDLTIPSTYAKKITTNKGETLASSNNINLGELDAVYNIKATKNPLPTSSRPSLIRIKPNSKTVMKIMSDKGSYVILSYDGVVEAYGQVVVYEKDGFYYIGGKDNMYYITILVQGSNPSIELQDGTMATFTRSDFERDIVAKGYIKETLPDLGHWVFTGDFPQLSDITNTLYLHMVSDNSYINMSDVVVEDGRAYIMPRTTNDYMEGKYFVRDWYSGGWTIGSQTYNPCIKLPEGMQGRKLLEFRLTSTHLSHNNSDFYCRVIDPFGTTLTIVQMKAADLSGAASGQTEQIKRYYCEWKRNHYALTEI